MNATTLATRWVDSRLDAGIAQLTAYNYRIALKPFCTMFCGVPLDQIDVPRLAAYRRMLQQTVSPGTAKIRWDMALAAIRWGQELGEVPPFLIPRDVRRMRGAPPHRRVWSRDEVRRMLDRCDPLMRTCVLLGVNLGYGNRDCARLEPRHVCGSVVDAPRHKTGAERRGWLWPETLDALRRCPPPLTNDAGTAIVKDFNDYLRPRFYRLLELSSVPRNGRGFYSLRRAYRTAVDSHPDRPAIDLTMGHATPGMGHRYVAWIDDERLRSVSMHARERLL